MLRWMRRLLPLLFLAQLAAGCSGDGDSEADRLPPSVQRQLPLDISLGNLCPGAETPPELVRDLRRKAEALLAQLRANPDALVRYTFYTEEEGPIRQDIPVREVAELQLDDLRSGSSDLGECAPDLQRRLEEGLS
jgi:hypothetical protein